MQDLALNWLVNQIPNYTAASENCGLWCTDENLTGALPTGELLKTLLLITNRWDLYQEALELNFNAEFSDFDLTPIADESLDYVCYRVSKEKPIVHHVLNEAWRCLKPQGKLLLSGHKNEGIKTYIEKTAKLLGCSKNIQKNTTAYNATLNKQNPYDATMRLDDNNYKVLRALNTASTKTPESTNLSVNLPHIDTKPGLFGWNKIDQGSAFLIEQLPGLFSSWSQPPRSCLDLGCGYGYLSLAAAQLDACGTIEHWHMTDNNAAALRAATHNAQGNGLNAEITATDCADKLQLKVDLILCNPPFHLGFSQSGDLTDKFLAAAQRLLSAQGTAIFVVNQFIPLERKAAGRFAQITTLADNGSFKVIRLSHQ